MPSLTEALGDTFLWQLRFHGDEVSDLEGGGVVEGEALADDIPGHGMAHVQTELLASPKGHIHLGVHPDPHHPQLQQGGTPSLLAQRQSIVGLRGEGITDAKVTT